MTVRETTRRAFVRRVSGAVGLASVGCLGGRDGADDDERDTEVRYREDGAEEGHERRPRDATRSTDGVAAVPIRGVEATTSDGDLHTVRFRVVGADVAMDTDSGVRQVAVERFVRGWQEAGGGRRSAVLVTGTARRGVGLLVWSPTVDDGLIAVRAEVTDDLPHEALDRSAGRASVEAVVDADAGSLLVGPEAADRPS